MVPRPEKPPDRAWAGHAGAPFAGSRQRKAGTHGRKATGPRCVGFGAIARLSQWAMGARRSVRPGSLLRPLLGDAQADLGTPQRGHGLFHVLLVRSLLDNLSSADAGRFGAGHIDLVGMLGGLGGFFLPPMFAYTKTWSGFPSSTFFCIFILVAICGLWMHITIVRMLHDKSPELAGNIDRPLEEARP